MLTSDRSVAYLDSSALVKLVVHERESEALAQFLAGHQYTASSELALVEVVRAVLNQGADAIARADATLAAIDLLRLNVPILKVAARLDPPVLRSLDAIHLAAALELGAELEALVTYDGRMANAARQLGIAVVMPGRE